MRLPEQMPSKPIAFELKETLTADASSAPADIEPAGCCAQVCLPFVGCHCVLELPVCP